MTSKASQLSAFAAAANTAALATAASATDVGTAYSNAIAYAAANTYVNNTFAPKTSPSFTGTLSAAVVTISGNLTVSGTTTYVNTTNLNIGDNIVSLNADVSGTPSENAGISVNRGTSANVAILWDESIDRWVATNDGTNYSNIALGSTGSSNSFGIIAVAGQSNVVADQSNDVLTIVAGNNMTITTSASGDTITFAAAGGGGGGGGSSNTSYDTFSVEQSDYPIGTIIDKNVIPPSLGPVSLTTVTYDTQDYLYVLDVSTPTYYITGVDHPYGSDLKFYISYAGRQLQAAAIVNALNASNTFSLSLASYGTIGEAVYTRSGPATYSDIDQYVSVPVSSWTGSGVQDIMPWGAISPASVESATMNGSTAIVGATITAVVPSSYELVLNTAAKELTEVSAIYVNGTPTTNADYRIAANTPGVFDKYSDLGVTYAMWSAYSNTLSLSLSAAVQNRDRYTNDYNIIESMFVSGTAFSITSNSANIWGTDYPEVTWELTTTANGIVAVSDPDYIALSVSTISTSNSSYPTFADYVSQGFGLNKFTIIVHDYPTEHKQLIGSASGNSYLSSVEQPYSVGDVLSYVPLTSSIDFKDAEGNIKKSITYNAATGEINYDGIFEPAQRLPNNIYPPKFIRAAANGAQWSNLSVWDIDSGSGWQRIIQLTEGQDATWSVLINNDGNSGDLRTAGGITVRKNLVANTADVGKIEVHTSLVLGSAMVTSTNTGILLNKDLTTATKLTVQPTPPVSGDPFYANTVILIKPDAPSIRNDGVSGVFSNSYSTLTRSVDVPVGGSGYSLSMPSYSAFTVTNPSSVNLAGASNYTIEFWRKASTGASIYFVSCSNAYDGGVGSGEYRVADDYPFYTTVFADGSRVVNAYNGVWLDETVWVHWAFVKSGGTYMLFRNGTQISTGNISTYASTSTKPFQVYNSVSSLIYNYRLTVGNARYTTTFTPSVAPYANSASDTPATTLIDAADISGGIKLMNMSTAPSSNYANGGYLYVQSGALKYRGANGTVTTLGAA